MKNRTILAILAFVLCICLCLGGCGAEPPAVTDAPVTTNAPQTDAIITESPVTDAPQTDAPVTDAPVIEEPLPVDDANTVYVDGTKNAENTYPDLDSAIAALPNGGTVVICGDVNVSTALTITAGGAITLTSRGERGDFTDTAAIRIGADINLNTPVTFKRITLDKVSDGNIYIVANGNPLVIDEGVFCRNNLASNYITLVGGAKSGTFEGNSDVTVKSGFFRNIFGGNYNGTFKGDSKITFIGGTVDNMIAGGSFMGNFEGNSTVDIGGDAVMVYLDSGAGVLGSCCGSGNSKYTFKGDISINLYGKARVNQNVYGTTRYSNVTTTGNVSITVKDDAFVYQNLYAGGYNGILMGNTSVVVDGGWVGVTLAGGSRGGTVNGNTYVEVNGGKINYYATNMHSSNSTPAGEYGVVGGGLTGAVKGNTTVVINGGDIYGNVYGGGKTTGIVSGSSTVTVTGGSIMCGVYADGYTKNSVKGTKTLNIDLSHGGELALGLSANVNIFTGGGTLTLFPEATISAETLTGKTTLKINGDPLDRTYISATKTDNAEIIYAPQGTEKLNTVAEGGKATYSVDIGDSYESVKVTFKHSAGAQIYLRPGLATSGTRMTADEKATGTTTFYLEPGLYNYAVYHADKDYKRKYIYVTGKEETLVLDHSTYLPKTGNGFEGANHAENSDEIRDLYYGTDELVGFTVPDTPYFTENRYGTRQFATNAEMLDFISKKVADCDYAYSFELFTSPGGTTVPAVIFTRDSIPAGATLEDAAKIIGAKSGRDILLLTALVHGNEPSAGEGALAMISEMCGEYGSKLLTGNIGAVIIVPRLNPDGADSFTRNTPNGDINLNRDYAILQSTEIKGIAGVMDLFKPTLTVDLHEAGLEPIYGESYVLTDVYDAAIMCAGIINNPFTDSTAVIKGENADRGMRTAELATEALKNLEKTGLRGYYYQSPASSLTTNSAYGLANGAYAFLVEIPGINSGDFVYARRVFAQVTAAKEIFALAVNANGQLAKEVNEAREALALSAQIYDENSPIILKHSYTRNDASTLLWNNPLVAADGTVRRAENITKYYVQDVAVKYRSLPTAYVLDANTKGIDKVLDVLDGHGISYFKLENGTALTLKQYSGNKDSAKLSAETGVTFANGAYIIPVDGYKAYIIATLFEPENGDTSESSASFVQAGYITADAVYRSEESFIAARLGLEGTYRMVDIPEGKTVASVKVNGTECTVYTEGTNLFAPAGEIEITFTDGTITTIESRNS